MKKLLAVTVMSFGLVSSFALAAPALAGDDGSVGLTNVPREQWLSTSEILQKIESKGYKVHEIEVDDGAYEFEATTSSGARIEGHAHPATGEILTTRPDKD